MNLQKRLILGFLIATCLTGVVATIVGIHLINKHIIGEVQRKVEQDINTARLIYNNSIERIVSQMRWIEVSSPFEDIIREREYEKLDYFSDLIRIDISQNSRNLLDMLSLVNSSGEVLYRAANPDSRGDSVMSDPVIRRCIEKGTLQVSTELMSVEKVLLENPLLSDRVNISLTETPQSIKISGKKLSDAMVIRVACPVRSDSGEMIGVLAGGSVVNKDYAIVDKIKETVYSNEKYKGVDMGFATIFQNGVRISTNVMDEHKKRAIGTTVSEEVYHTVIEEGKNWIGRAFVVNDWYISSYSPIYDIHGSIIGMLYTGILEAKYRDLKTSAMWIFLGITSLGIIISFFISYTFGNTIIGRIRLLKEATDVIASGNLDYKLGCSRFSGFDMLDEAFNNMTKSLKDRDDRLKKVFQQLTKTERLAALGQIAAGVAHEINNPLGGILLYSNLVLEELDDNKKNLRHNIEKIIYQTNRCKEIVQNLLDFSRTPSGEFLPFQINSIIHTSLNLLKDQSMFLGIEIETRLAENLPDILGDRWRLEQVFLNLFVNAADAMNGQGHLKVETKLIKRYSHDDETTEGMETEKVCLLTSTNTVKITVSDTGKGIDKNYLPHIFEPFFTTKEPGKGTGLGLSIAYGIIKKYNGFIDVESENGMGTTVTMYLPAQDGSMEQIDWANSEERYIG
ncbi:MAG: cache domain-containing protein [Syntrophales bacterium]|nr:cache domain-containing protein [Syntrophales bacterium]MDY0045177.1 cache domain-containing protein [Syntrophales bacterium]